MTNAAPTIDTPAPDAEAIPALALPAPPPPKRKGWRDFAWMVVAALVGAVMGSAAMKLIMNTGSLGVDPFSAMGLWAVIALPLGVLIAITVHELGHLAAGMAGGMRFLLFVVGPVMVLRGERGLIWKFNRHLSLAGGLAACVPTGPGVHRRRFAWLVAGGPIASLVLGVAGLALGWPGATPFSASLCAVGAISIVILLPNLLPLTAGGFRTDGGQLLDLWRGRSDAAERVNTMALLAAGLAGTRPRELDATPIDALVRSENPVNRTAGGIYRLLMALDTGRDPQPAMALILDGWNSYPVGFRHELAALMVLGLLQQGADPAQLDAWMDAARKGPDMSGYQPVAEAALAVARGDRTAFDIAAIAAGLSLSRMYDRGTAKLLAEMMAGFEAKLGPAV